MSDAGEKALKSQLLNLAQDDFIILPNAKGKSVLHVGHEVEIDFMFYPKEHLIAAGFDAVWFGVEVKHFGNKCDTEKMSRFICQSISYVQSEFQIDGKVIRPAFVLGYSDVEKAIKLKSDINECAYRQWFSLLHLAGLMNVGVLEEYEQRKNSLGGWYIRFISSTWFYKNNGRFWKDSNYNIYKINVGNCSN